MTLQQLVPNFLSTKQSTQVYVLCKIVLNTEYPPFNKIAVNICLK